jgi:hypothetical protein
MQSGSRHPSASWLVMVRKYSFEMRGPYPLGDVCDLRVDAERCAALAAANAELHGTLNSCKNQISRWYYNRRWDVCKKVTNEYELVYTSSSELPGIAAHTPISRSFFKLWEVLHDRPTIASRAHHPGPMTAAFLGEGPGGFIESFARYRAGGCMPPRSGGACSCRTSDAAVLPSDTPETPTSPDSLHGMTLLSRHKNIPNWKVSASSISPGATLRLHRGADGTGDLYHISNIDALVADVGAGACHLVTADGGFDFSNDFNNQEDASLRLIVAEAYAALRLQRPGGSLLLKLYDLHALATLRLVHCLRSCYKTMHIIKPLTSRPANSEKYVLCEHFVCAPNRLIAAMRACCVSGSGAPQVNHALRRALYMPASFVQDILHFNTVYIARQVGYIGRTILLIQQGDNSETRDLTRSHNHSKSHSKSQSHPMVGHAPSDTDSEGADLDEAAPSPEPAPCIMSAVKEPPAAAPSARAQQMTITSTPRASPPTQRPYDARGEDAHRLHLQLGKSLRWCHKYHMPASLDALKHYSRASE